MKILLSNDDGVNSSGILSAKLAVEEFGETYVVAPANQQSGIGHALTLFEPLRVNSLRLKDDSLAYSVSGTPTDAVTLGIYEIMDEKPDLVISGINVGQNTGKGELTTSGTMGAAMEAAGLGIPAIAVSQNVEKQDIKFDEGSVEVDFSATQKVLKRVVKKVIAKGLPEGVDLLNLNVPSNPDSYEPVVSNLGKRMYCPVIEMRLDPRGKPYYWIGGNPYNGNAKGTDGYNLKVNNLPTLTPLSLDMTVNIESFKEW